MHTRFPAGSVVFLLVVLGAAGSVAAGDKHQPPHSTSVHSASVHSASVRATSVPLTSVHSTSVPSTAVPSTSTVPTSSEPARVTGRTDDATLQSKSNAGGIAGIVVGVIGLVVGGLVLLCYLKRGSNKTVDPESSDTWTNIHPKPVSPNGDELPTYGTDFEPGPIEMSQMQPQLNASAALLPVPGIDTAAANARTITPARSFSSLTTVQSTATNGRRVAGGPNTRIGRRPGTGESGLSVDTQGGARRGRAPSIMSLHSAHSSARPPSAGNGAVAGAGRRRAGTGAGGSPAPPTDHPPSPHPHAGNHTPADAQFLAALHAVALPPSEIQRINYLLAVGGGTSSTAEKPLPETLVASLPDFAPAQMAFVRRLWACDVPLAEISRAVEEMRERERERLGSGENGGEVGVGVGGLGAAPPGYEP